MSKIEEYQEAKRVADSVTENYLKATGQDSPTNDKARIECKLNHMLPGVVHPVGILSFHASYGTYGCSSSYAALDPPTANYVAKAITAMGKSIMCKAAELVQADAENARRAAEDEARAVLEQVAQ